MTAANRDLDQAGHSLQMVIAVSYSNTQDHIRREMSLLDGYGARGGDEVIVSSSGRTIRVEDEDGNPDNVPVTGVEAAMLARADLWSFLEGLELQKKRTLLEIRKLNELVVAGSRLRMPRNVVKPEDQKRNLCCSGGADKYQAIEWHDPDCFMPAVKRGLCQTHYDRFRHVCIRDGQWGKIEGDFKPGPEVVAS